MRTKTEIINSMKDIMPFKLPIELEPYIMEAMDIHAKEYFEEMKVKYSLPAVMPADTFDVGMRVKFYDKEEQRTVYGKVTGNHADKVTVEWDDMINGVEHEREDWENFKRI